MNDVIRALHSGYRARRAARDFQRALDSAPSESVRAELLHVWQVNAPIEIDRPLRAWLLRLRAGLRTHGDAYALLHTQRTAGLGVGGGEALDALHRA